MKVFLTEHDTFNYTIYNEKEAFEMFGYELKDDFEYFIEIPDKLVDEYKECFKLFWELNQKISDYEVKK